MLQTGAFALLANPFCHKGFERGPQVNEEEEHIVT